MALPFLLYKVRLHGTGFLVSVISNKLVQANVHMHDRLITGTLGSPSGRFCKITRNMYRLIGWYWHAHKCCSSAKYCPSGETPITRTGYQFRDKWKCQFEDVLCRHNKSVKTVEENRFQRNRAAVQ